MFEKLKEKLRPKNEITIYSPISGSVLPIEDVKDPTFSEKMLGDGIAVIPDSTKVYSPVNGTIDLMFDTGHAVSIKSDEGVEILVHIGLNTIELKGAGFRTLKASGDSIKVGDPLIEFDREEIAGKGYDISTPVVILNMDDYKEVLKTKKSRVDTGEEILVLTRK